MSNSPVTAPQLLTKFPKFCTMTTSPLLAHVVSQINPVHTNTSQA